MTDGPLISIEQNAVAATNEAGLWHIGWTIANKGSTSLHVISVRLPHGQFKADEQRFEPALALNTGGKTEFCALVRCDEPAGLVTENAFLIFQVICSAEAWRVFVRIRVIVKTNGEPETAVELITTQRVGFSEQR
jgi:hypothetical protein